jgi:catechol 2,3-dioxygenase-like lactoylglutathione lyase family enzyme
MAELQISRGLPGLCGVEHIGFTVPNLEEATSFLVDVIGCEHAYSLGPIADVGDWMSTHLNVERNAVIREIRFFRCRNGPNLEVFQFDGVADPRPLPPRNSDVGGHHVAFYVDDMSRAVAHLRAHGVVILGQPTRRTAGPSAGQEWVYFLAPWGMQFELVSYPAGKKYEREGGLALWRPKPSSGNQNS